MRARPQMRRSAGFLTLWERGLFDPDSPDHARVDVRPGLKLKSDRARQGFIVPNPLPPPAFTASHAGFFILSQSGERPER